MLRLPIMVVAVLTALLIGLLGVLAQPSLLALLGIGAAVWAVTLGAVVLDARCSSEVSAVVDPLPQLLGS